MIGLSLSFCVIDILEGRISEEDVEVIITSCKCSTQEDWEIVREHYVNTYWRWYGGAREVADRLYSGGETRVP
jgi:hypothetical protein